MELLEFIKKRRERGFSDQATKIVLTSKGGWSGEEVDEAIRSLAQSHPVATSNPSVSQQPHPATQVQQPTSHTIQEVAKPAPVVPSTPASTPAPAPVQINSNIAPNVMQSIDEHLAPNQASPSSSSPTPSNQPTIANVDRTSQNHNTGSKKHHKKALILVIILTTVIILLSLAVLFAYITYNKKRQSALPTHQAPPTEQNPENNNGPIQPVVEEDVYNEDDYVDMEDTYVENTDTEISDNNNMNDDNLDNTDTTDNNDNVENTNNTNSENTDQQ